MEQLLITAITIMCSIIGAVSAAFGIVKSMTEKHEKERKEREERQEALQLIILKSLDGALDLSISTATAISRIPSAHCNGDMHAALKAAQKTKEDQRRALTAAGVSHMMHDD